MANPDDVRVAIWTVCVSDLEESTRFYCEGLGFTEGQTHETIIEPGSDSAKAFDMPSARTVGRFVSRPEVALRLVAFEEPKPVGGRGRKPTNQIGPRSLVICCPDPKAVGQRLEKLGGAIVHEREGGPFAAVIVTDPDGFTLQLEALPIEAFQAAFKK